LLSTIRFMSIHRDKKIWQDCQGRVGCGEYRTIFAGARVDSVIDTAVVAPERRIRVILAW